VITTSGTQTLSSDKNMS